MDFDTQTTTEVRQELKTKVKQAENFCLLWLSTAAESPWVNRDIKTGREHSWATCCWRAAKQSR